MNTRFGVFGLLVLMGVGWGITQPLSKIAVSEGYRHFGIIFWQFVIGVIVLGTISALRGKGLPLGRKQLRLYLIIALIGTLLPNAASYQAAVHLPAGVLSIIMSLVPMMAFPIALAMRLDRFEFLRFIGLALGLCGVLVLVLPAASLPDPAMVVFIPLALIAPFFYAIEGNVVAKWGTYGADAVQVLLGASLVGVVLALPLALITGTWISPVPPYGVPDLAILLGSVIHALAYAGYVGLVGRAGPVFAVQVSYLVTGFGMVWAMVLLGESYSHFIWLALVLMLAGIMLVQPRRRRALVVQAKPGQDAPLES